MSTKFVVLASDASAQQQIAITTALTTEGAWWHWFTQSWLFVTTKNFTAPTLRDAIGASLVNANVSVPSLLVLRVEVFPGDAGHWGGYSLPKTEEKGSTKWLNEEWSNP